VLQKPYKLLFKAPITQRLHKGELKLPLKELFWPNREQLKVLKLQTKPGKPPRPVH
jgi:hypothetical protein